VDTLGRLVQALAPTGAVDLHCRFAAPWAVENATAPENELPYHVILEGHGYLEAGGARQEVEGGGVLLFPYGAAHILRSSVDGPLNSAVAVAEQRRFNGVVTLVERTGDGAPFDMLCGRFVLAGDMDALWNGLPPVLRVRTAGRAALDALIGVLRGEAETPKPGGAALIDMLSTALFTLIMRSLVAEQQWQGGVLGLISEPRLAPAVDEVLKDPGHEWTLAGLADIAHMSRASFIRHFGQASGLKAMEWISGVRLAHAARLLRQGRLSAGRVAEQSGYASEAAFGRAFKKLYGVGPGTYRRQHAVAEAPTRA
jgi:AraC family transcriptional regulator, activator of mtrCDE